MSEEKGRSHIPTGSALTRLASFGSVIAMSSLQLSRQRSRLEDVMDACSSTLIWF